MIRALADRVFRLLLFLYPRQFRERFGRCMLADFRELIERDPRIATIVHDLYDLVKNAAREQLPWLRPRASGSANSPPHQNRGFAVAGLLTDLRYIVRTLARRPAYAALAVMTLSIGIGATTTVFSLADAVIFQPLAFHRPDRLVSMYSFDPSRGFDNSNVSYPDFLEWRAERDVLRHAAVSTLDNVDVSGQGDPERIQIARIGAEFFEVLQTRPILGRTIGESDHRPDAPRTVVIHEDLWTRRFAADSGVIGRAIRLDGETYTIAGVVGNDGGWPLTAAAWTSLQFGANPPSWALRRSNHMWNVIGRLEDGVTLHEADLRISNIARRSAHAQEIEREKNWDGGVEPLAAVLAGREVRRAFAIFLGGVSFVLLIACINVSNLLLTQASIRKQELAVRAALGAGTRRLVGLLLGESTLLALLGGVAGLGLSYFAISRLVALAPTQLPRLEQVGLNLSVLSFSLGTALIASLLAGLIPALYASRTDITGTLKDAARSGGILAKRTRRALVVAELAISVVLLIGAGLMLRSFQAVLQVDPGYAVENRLAFTVTIPPSRYSDDASVRRFYDEAITRLIAIPEVSSAAVTKTLPLGGGGSQLFRSFLEEGAPEPPAGEEHGGMWYELSPAFFETFGLRVFQGRAFAESDDASAVPVAIVNQTMAEQMFADGQALGKRIRSWRDENVYREVVGVVADVAYRNLTSPSRPEVYVPASQSPRRAMGFLVKTNGDPLSALPAVRDAMRSVDADVALARIATMDELLRASFAGTRFMTMLLTVLGALALLLAAVGVYGLISYTVAQRTHELGIRMALGAVPGRLVALVLGQAGLVTGVGVGLGILGGVGVGQVLSRFLFGIRSIDVIAFGGTVLLLAGVSLLASYLPARRATKVDPVEALRYE